jgi:hypothetical protein
MSFPKNPKTLIVDNEFGTLNELDIWKYYQKVKTPFLMQLIGREIMIFLATDVNKTVVIRKKSDGSLIYINMRNYDEIVSGRTLSFHSCMKKTEKIGIVDIDISDFNLAKEATKNIHKFLSVAPFALDVGIRFTGKESFHVICYLKRNMYVDSIRELLRDYLLDNPFGYDVMHKRQKEVPNLDLATNKYRGGFITPHSLSTLGLKCMNVMPRGLLTFNKRQATI